MDILELNSIITKMNNSLTGFNSRFEQMEGSISKPEHKSIEIIQSGEKEENE